MDRRQIGNKSKNFLAPPPQKKKKEKKGVYNACSAHVWTLNI
jgi:hypothetical protein